MKKHAINFLIACFFIYLIFVFKMLQTFFHDYHENNQSSETARYLTNKGVPIINGVCLSMP